MLHLVRNEALCFPKFLRFCAFVESSIDFPLPLMSSHVSSWKFVFFFNISVKFPPNDSLFNIQQWLIVSFQMKDKAELCHKKMAMYREDIISKVEWKQKNDLKTMWSSLWSLKWKSVSGIFLFFYSLFTLDQSLIEHENIHYACQFLQCTQFNSLVLNWKMM